MADLAVWRRLATEQGAAQFARFLAVGLLNAAFGYGVFVLLIWAGLASLPALVTATMAGVIFNFQTTRRLVFVGNSGSFGRFVALYGAVLAVNWAALSAMEGRGMPPWMAQGVLTLPVALLSFAVQKLLIFAKSATPV